MDPWSKDLSLPFFALRHGRLTFPLIISLSRPSAEKDDFYGFQYDLEVQERIHVLYVIEVVFSIFAKPLPLVAAYG